MSDISKLIPDFEHDARKLGLTPCPDCVDDICTFNCGPTTIETQRIVAAGVYALEKIQADQQILEKTRTSQARGALRLMKEFSRFNPGIQDLPERVQNEVDRRRREASHESG